MKKKNLKKIANLISNEINNNYPVKSSEEEYRSDYDPEVSEKFRKLVLNIIQYKENIVINIIDNRFSISTNDVNVIKNSYMPKSKNLNKVYNEDDYLEIMVDEKGFYINLGYRKRSRYADDKMFKDLSPAIRERLKEINFENFDDIWSDVMKKSGVIRDNNLDELGI